MINQNCRLTLTKAMANLSGRFKSGNNTPVERVYITKDEWGAIADGVETLTHFQEKTLLAQVDDESEEHF